MSNDPTAAPSTTTTTPPAFTVPDTLSKFLISRTTWLAENPPFTHLAISALVFHTTPAGTTRLLLIQRAPGDAFPNVWEYPGGACEPSSLDPTILHGVVRELLEESGLTATKIVRQVGGVHSWLLDDGVTASGWGKLSFEVDVAEMQNGKEMGEAERKGVLEESMEGVCRVRLDAEEHQRYLWVTEEEVRSGKVDGEKIEVMDEVNRGLLLAGFEARRERVEKVD